MVSGLGKKGISSRVVDLLLSSFIIGLVAGSIISVVTFFLPFSGLFGMFFIPGLAGVLFALSLAIPGAFVASIVATGWKRGMFLGAWTAAFGYLILVLFLRPELVQNPFTGQIALDIVYRVTILVSVTGFLAGALGGWLGNRSSSLQARRTRRPLGVSPKTAAPLVAILVVLLIFPALTVPGGIAGPPVRILVDGEPVELGSISLRPELARVEAALWWFVPTYPEDAAPEPRVTVTFVELDHDNTYVLADFWLEWWYGEENYGVACCSGTLGRRTYSSGDVLEFHGTFEVDPEGIRDQLASGYRLVYPLRFFVFTETVRDGVSFWTDIRSVGQEIVVSGTAAHLFIPVSVKFPS